MRNFFEKLLSSGNDGRAVTGLPLNFAKSKKQILRELQISRDTGAIVGVYSHSLGEGMFLVAVESIDSSGKEELITFQRYEMSGHILTRSEFAISEIRMVFPFNGLMGIKAPAPCAVAVPEPA